MSTSTNDLIEALRSQAEKRVPNAPVNVDEMSIERIKRLVYELEVHQEELKIQNEELRRTHVELHESNDRYEDLYNFAPVGYLTIDPTGTIVKSNLTAATILGRDRSSIVGSRLDLFCDPIARAVLKDHIDLVGSSQSRQSCEVEFSTSGMSKLFARLDSNFDDKGSDANGQIRMILTDITQRKEIEFALAEKDKYFRAIVDSAPMLICYLDSESRIQFYNLAFQSWFDVLPEAMHGRSFPEIVDPQTVPEIKDYLNDVFAGHRVDFELRIVHQVKGPRHLQTMLVPDINLAGEVKGCHCLSIDITERKVVEQQNARRRILEAQLAELNANEREVFELLIRGKSNKEIAFAIDIGLRTAERRRKIVFEKLQVNSLADLLQQLADIQGVKAGD